MPTSAHMALRGEVSAARAKGRVAVHGPPATLFHARPLLLSGVRSGFITEA